MATININANASDEFKEKLVQGLEEACIMLTNEAKLELTNMGGVDTGILRASLTHKVYEHDLVGSVGTAVEYAPYYHEGTGIYARKGNGRKEVPWVYRTPDGKFHSTKGQKPHPFLENAFNNNANKVKAIFTNIL